MRFNMISQQSTKYDLIDIARALGADAQETHKVNELKLMIEAKLTLLEERGAINPMVPPAGYVAKYAEHIEYNRKRREEQR